MTEAATMAAGGVAEICCFSSVSGVLEQERL